MKKIIGPLLMLLVCTLFTVNLVAAQEELPLLTEIDTYAAYAEFSADDKVLLTSSTNGDVTLWNVTTGAWLSTIEHDMRGKVKAFFSKDHNKIFIGGEGPNGVKIDEYDAKTGKYSKTIIEYKDYYHREFYESLIVNKDRTKAYFIDHDIVVIIDLISGQQVVKSAEDGYFTALAYNNVTNELAIGDSEGIIYILDGTTGKFKIKTTSPFLSSSSKNIESVIYTNNGEYLFVMASQGNIERFDVIDYAVVSQSDEQFADSGGYGELQISFNDKYIASFSTGLVDIYDVETGDFLGDFSKALDTYVTFSHDNKKVLIGRDIYDATAITGSELGSIYITGGSIVVPLEGSVNYGVATLTNDGTAVSLNATDIEWSVADEHILSFFYGGFTGKQPGITSLTAYYRDFSTTIPIIVTKPFVDVPATDSNYKVIHFMKEYGIINGYDDGTYRPNQAIPRHHIAAMIGRSGVDLQAIRSAKAFKDIPTSHPNYANIQNLYRAGVLDGSGDKFNPNQNITHIQLAKILTNIFGFEKADTKKYSFGDIKKESWGQPYAEIMVSNEIMPFPKGAFNANEPVTRSQFANYFYNALLKSNNL